MPGNGGQSEADRIAAVGRQNGFVELGNLRLDPEQHRGQRLERSSSCRGKVWIGLLMEEGDQLARVASPLRHHDAQLCKVTAQGIDQGRPLPNQKIAGSMQHEGALLLRALDRDEAHRRPCDGLTDRRRIRGIILLPAQIGFDVGGRDQADVMPEGHERAGPVVSRRAGLQPDQARRKGAEEALAPGCGAAPCAGRSFHSCRRACSWKTFFAISRPIVAISGMMSGSSPVLQHAHSGMSDAGGGRHPRHHVNLEMRSERCRWSGMSKPVSYKRHRFPPEIIAHAVWLYFRFPLSLRLVEEMLLERGIVVSYETVRRWALKFGPAYARRLRRKTPSRRDIWHLDEVVVTHRWPEALALAGRGSGWLRAR